MSEASELRGVVDTLDRMVPEGVVARVWTTDDVPELMGDEGAAVARAVESRRAEFARGRACARAAIVALGGPLEAIPVGEKRAPTWPRGFVGSITHASGLVAAVVARSDVVAGIGLDAEPARALPFEVRKLVLTESETRTGDPLLETVTFSAKESIYKAVFPLTGSWIEFTDVEVSVTPETGQFTAVRLRGGDGAAVAALKGRFAVAGGYVLTCGYLPATWRA